MSPNKLIHLGLLGLADLFYLVTLLIPQARVLLHGDLAGTRRYPTLSTTHQL